MGTHPLALAVAAFVALSLHASPAGSLRFNVKRLSARHGTVRLVMKNPKTSGLDHAIAIKGHGVWKDGAPVGPGGTSVLTLRLKPGRYTFYCPVPGHEAAGMKGTLVVR